VNGTSSTILEEWNKHDTVTEDVIAKGVVTETNPRGNKRLAFQTRARQYSQSTHGNIKEVLWLAMKDYQRSKSKDKRPIIEFCVLFERTKYPKMILKSDFGKFFNEKSTLRIIDHLIERDGLGSIEKHTPLEHISYNPMSHKFDERVHGKYALRGNDDRSVGTSRESKTASAVVEGSRIMALLEQIDQRLTAFEKRITLVEESI
jgi:hypothetical protein